MLLYLETHYLIPFLSRTTGLEPVIFWFIVAGLGMFLPLLVLAYYLLQIEGNVISKNTWKERLRFRKMTRQDWYWSLGGIVLISILSLIIMKSIELTGIKTTSHPSFMSFEPLTPGRYWYLLLWFPYWILNIMGEEILWRGVILPRQEEIFGNRTWLLHGAFWGIFHLAFGLQLLVTLLPILFVQSFIVQRQKNSWTGVLIHALINGPSFIAICFGLIK